MTPRSDAGQQPVPLDAGGPGLDQDALEAQLQVFAREIGGLYRSQKARAEQLEEALAALKTAYLETIRSFAFVVEAKDAYTGLHLERCRAYGVALMEELGVAGDHPDAEYGFLLHDAGKVGVPERILSKPGPLTAAEWRVMRAHPVIGYQMLENIPFMTTAAEIVRCHHEMFDGSGYPQGLKAEEIPLPARAFSIVDAFDAMTTDRPYRAAMPTERAAAELTRMAGTQFDPDVVGVFLPLIDRLPPIAT
ncbi:MAG: HD-GYP domain-containing protein [Actinobacteria bacterium]|nr:HD-GYP domain-containing protein [Actinomycetota bacterium]